MRDFYERLGDARIDPASEIGEVFQLVGQDINDADANLLDFLSSVCLDLEDRSQQIFAIRTILTGDSEELLTALTDANFQARLEANVTLALSPEDRARILESDATLSDVGNALSRLVDEFVVSIGIAPELQAAARAIVDAAEFIRSIDVRGPAGEIADNPVAFVQGQIEGFFGGVNPFTGFASAPFQDARANHRARVYGCWPYSSSGQSRRGNIRDHC